MVTASAARALRRPKLNPTAPAPAAIKVSRRVSFVLMLYPPLYHVAVCFRLIADVLSELAQQSLLPIEKFRAERIARARQRNADFRLDRAGVRRHHDHPVREIDRLGDI